MLILFSGLVLGVTFLLFPIDDFRLLWQEKLFNLSYLLAIGIFILCMTILLGIITSQLWRSHLQYVRRQLEQLNNDQPFMKEEYKDLQSIDIQLEQLQKKIAQQVEHVQQLATERAEDREKSLQEVVIQERNRLARDLHDSVSQQLFAASMMMSAINESAQINDPALLKQVKMVEKMIHQSQLEMRALLLHLRPVALKGKTLQDGIKDLLTELMNRTPIDLEYHLEDFAIDKGIEDQLFRILQEAVSNTLRHAETTKLEVILIKRDELIIMRVIDHGKGFNMQEVGTGSYGLETMKERTYDLGGNFKMISLPSKGTRIEVKIPFMTKAGEGT
jgi:NarL family two-component system sensor histidine kinase LiaS